MNLAGPFKARAKWPRNIASRPATAEKNEIAGRKEIMHVSLLSQLHNSDLNFGCFADSDFVDKAMGGV